MNDETPLGAVPAVASTDTIYTVVAGDSLSKIALRYYGDGARYPEIAARNNIAADAIVYIGQRLIIPAGIASSTVQNLPASPGGSSPAVVNGEIIETVTTTARRVKFWEDWRFWAVAGSAVVVLYWMNRRK